MKMKNFVSTRTAGILVGGALIASSLACGWSSRQSRNNTQTGVSESGYPGGHAADPGSPALEAMRREGKKGGSEHDQKKTAGGPGAKTTETHAPGQPEKSAGPAK
jgi:hypothetical protein